MEGLATPFEGIAQGIVNLGQHFSNVLSYLNPFSENFFGIKLVEFIGDLLSNLFVPKEDIFGNLQENLRNKFYFTTQIQEIFESLLNDFDYGDSVPSFSITYYGKTLNIIDFSPLASLTNLKKLSLRSHYKMDISSLASLTKLTHLSLNDCGKNISDFSPLIALRTTLQKLYLKNTDIDSSYDGWLDRLDPMTDVIFGDQYYFEGDEDLLDDAEDEEFEYFMNIRALGLY